MNTLLSVQQYHIIFIPILADQDFEDFEKANCKEKKFVSRAIHILLPRSCTFPKAPIEPNKAPEYWPKLIKEQEKLEPGKAFEKLETLHQPHYRIEQIDARIFRKIPVQNYGKKRRNPINLNVFRVYNGAVHETVLYDFPMCLKSALGKLEDGFMQQFLTFQFQKGLEEVIQRNHPKAVPFIRFVHINDSWGGSEIYAKTLYKAVTKKSTYKIEPRALLEVVTRDKKND